MFNKKNIKKRLHCLQIYGKTINEDKNLCIKHYFVKVPLYRGLRAIKCQEFDNTGIYTL